MVYQVYFIKENWDVVGKDVVHYCSEILNGDRPVDEINDMIIILIPKVFEPEDMTHFRPISLCRVIFKIVSKVLSNRLKSVLPCCISQNQSSFVLRQMIHDNALIAHELLHYLQSAKNGSNKGFVAKLDMSKTYDRVEWNVLEAVMNHMGFSTQWILKIMKNVRSVRYVVKCNLHLMKEIRLERGLR